MVHFASHCRVTNAIYYSSQLPSAFPTPAQRSAGAIHLDLQTGTVPSPRIPLGDLSIQPPREDAYGAVAWLHFGPADNDWAAVYFAPGCLTRNFFIALFPAGSYRVSGHFRPPFSSRESRWEREQPVSRFYVFFGCPVCGQYQRKHGFLPLSGNRDPGPFPFYCTPVEFAECPRCHVDQRRCNGTAGQLRIGKFS